MKNLNLVLLTTTLLLSAGAKAASSTTSNHGEGLPTLVGESPYALQYREDFMTKHGIKLMKNLGLLIIKIIRLALDLLSPPTEMRMFSSI